MSDKLSAFRSYDFDSNEEWMSYLSSVEIIGTDRAAAIGKLKAKWYQRNIDPDFDISAAAPTKPAAHTTGNQSSTQHGGSRSESAGNSNSGPTPRATSMPSARGSSSSSSSSSSRMQGYMFWLHIALLVSALLYVQPLNGRLARSAWRRFIQLAILSQGLKVYSAHGLPRLSLASLRDFAQRAMMTTDFQYLILALVFISGPASAMLLPPFCVLATYHIFAHLAQHYSSHALWKARGEKAWAWLRARQTEALVLNATSEIGLAITSLLLVPTSLAHLPKAYMLWQMLKVRYWAPDSQAYQRMAWARLGEKTAGVRARLPVLNKPITWAQGWFNSVPGR